MFDSRLTFKQQVDQVCGTALSALNRLGPIIQSSSICMGLQLYNAHVRPHIERTYAVWCGVNNTDFLKVDRVHRSALLRITGAFVSTSTASMEILTNTMPIRLRLECTLLQEHVRLLTKPQNDHLRCLVMGLLGDAHFLDHRIVTPIHILKMALKGIPDGLPIPEEAPKHSLERLQATVPESSGFDSDLGSSGNRTAEMAARARLKALNLIASFEDGAPVVFTDGSALGNPGPTGAAAICYPEGIKSEPISIKEAVAKLSTSYNGELHGIKLATEFIKSHTFNQHHTQVHILSDCQSAITSISSRDTHKSHQNCIDDIHRNVQVLRSRDITVNLHWVAGHVDLAGNEIADQAAKQAANEASTSQLPFTTSKSTITGIITRAARNKWQRGWTNGTAGRELHDIHPKVPTRKYYQPGNRKDEVKLIRIRSGHASLKDQLHKLKLAETPECDCGLDRQTINHVLLHCPNLNTPREKLKNTIDYTYHQHNTPIWERTVSLQDTIWPQHSNKNTSIAVTQALQVFLRNTSI